MSQNDDEVDLLLRRNREFRKQQFGVSEAPVARARASEVKNDDSDAELEMLMSRTKESIERLKSNSASPSRSPLRPRDNQQMPNYDSGLKKEFPSKLGKTDSSGSKSCLEARARTLSSPRLPVEPVASSTSSKVVTPIKERSSSVLKEDLADGGRRRKEESYNRETTETKTVITSDPVMNEAGRPVTYTKTTITEKEETIEKREYVKVTELRGGRDKLPLLQGERKNVPENLIKTVTFKNSPITSILSPLPDDSEDEHENANDCRQMGSPSRFGSCRDVSPNSASKRVTQTTPSTPRTPLQRRESDDDQSEDLQSGRRLRLRALATKFRDYDEDDLSFRPHMLASAAASSSPRMRDKTKTVDVDQELRRSPIKKLLPSQPSFIGSLKAQGFEESPSRSKLVYDFGKESKSKNESLPSSPSKLFSGNPHPHQFTSVHHKPDADSVSSSSGLVNKPVYRSNSPTRLASPSARSSPFIPHPLQFVSPQKAADVSLLTAKRNQSGPPKPARTFESLPEHSDTQTKPRQSKADSEKQLQWKRVPAKEENDNHAASDVTPRINIQAKRNIFEGSPSASRSTPDPAMLPMSERKKLFEKNATVPKPVARFGESVTPAMLSRANIETPDVRPQPRVSATEPSWKRKRAPSPDVVQPAVDCGTANVKSRLEKGRRLFEKDWRESDIARQQEEQKKKDMEVLFNRFSHQKELIQEEKPVSSPSHSVKPIKVPSPKPGNIYPNLEDLYDERPDTAMSGQSEAPSLGTTVKTIATSNKLRSETKASRMSAIVESDDRNVNENDGDDELDEEETMDYAESVVGDQINDMLDEALDDSSELSETTPPKFAKLAVSPSRGVASSPSGISDGSWEFCTPMPASRSHKNYKTPRIEDMGESPNAPLPMIDTEEGPAPAAELMHTVSFYRKQKPTVHVTPMASTFRHPISSSSSSSDDDRHQGQVLREKLLKLQEEMEEQMQRRLQASKALDVCQSKNEFEGSFERVEFERLLLEAHHKYAAATTEIHRLKTESSRGLLPEADSKKMAHSSKGTISISGIALPLKPDFLRMLERGEDDDTVHYFVCLVKYRSQVIATQMLSTQDGITHGKMLFTNLIKINDVDFDFRIYLEVYGLQAPKEHLSHEAKYHIKKDKSLFNLSTPLKMLKKQESRLPRHENPVNKLTVRKPRFGMVGYTTVTIDTLKNSAYKLEQVPPRSPLVGGLEMRLSVHSESKVEEKGFLTLFTDANGFGNWCRRWCLLRDNTLYFWKYPEDEGKIRPSEQISLHDCVTETITLAPREVSSRINTFMLEIERPIKVDDRPALNIHLDRKRHVTCIRHLLAADTREERLQWCDILNRALDTLRAWDPSSARPKDDSSAEDDSSSLASTDIW